MRVITAKMGVIRWNQASQDLWERQSCSRPRAPITHATLLAFTTAHFCRTAYQKALSRFVSGRRLGDRRRVEGLGFLGIGYEPRPTTTS